MGFLQVVVEFAALGWDVEPRAEGRFRSGLRVEL